MTKETGTAAELNLKPGDVVEFLSPPYTVSRAEEVEPDIFGGSVWLDLLGFRSGVFTNEILRIVSRASYAEGQPPATPKTWGEMTDAEQGALLLADHRREVVEWRDPEDINDDWDTKGLRFGCPDMAYRVRPEPKRETVTLYGGSERTGYFAASAGGKLDNDTHRITFDLIDGKPDCASIRMEEL